MSGKTGAKTVCYEGYGGGNRLRFGTIPLGDPGSDQVMVRVLAAALNPIDWKLREGQARWVYPLRFPVVPGFDFCGRVEACGRNVEGFRPGDRVCGISDRRAGGTLAEKCICSASVLARVPEEMPDEEAAGLPLAGLSALQGLRRHGRFAPGMRVLVVGASGGVGHLAVQLAAHWGGHVSAVCGPDNIGWVRDLGAEAVFDYRRPGWFEEAGKFDLIFDVVGGARFWAGAASPGAGWKLRHDPPRSPNIFRSVLSRAVGSPPGQSFPRAFLRNRIERIDRRLAACRL